MKCPVCDAEIKNDPSNAIKCIRCGFDDIRTEFINDEERNFWYTYVVKPCKYAYKLNHTLQSEVAMLRREIKKLSVSGITTINTDAASAPLPAQPKIIMVEGWNYNDPIAHPNSAAGSYYSSITFSVSDIKSQMTSSSTATITFLVKKESDKKGKSSTENFSVRYRVKDKGGVIILNDSHYVKGLQVGDVTRESIKLTGVTAGEYVIDFVSYN